MKSERPSPRRMMMHFDSRFLEWLPTFKIGFGDGNELGRLVHLMSLDARRGLSLLDIGSADGDRLKRMITLVQNWQPDVKATAIEPIAEGNPKLNTVSRELNIEWLPMHLEAATDLKDESFDVITSTHCAYYYFNQPLAHRELFRLLKPDGKLIVTLVSQFCVLNRLTERLLTPHQQVVLNAESYIGLMSKLGLFSLERVESFRRLLDGSYYTAKDERLEALGYILSRHRLREQDVRTGLERFRQAVQALHGQDRINLIMFFRKASVENGGVILPSADHLALDKEINQLRAMSVELSQRVPSETREVIAGDLDTLITEAQSSHPRVGYLSTTGRRLIDAAFSAGWESNRVKDRVDVILRMAKARIHQPE